MGVMAGIDITERQYQQICNLLQVYLPDTRVWAFGSRVKFTATKTSDLDLVAFCSVEQILDLAALREAFEESDLPFRVDILDWNRIPDSFRNNIEAAYTVITDISE